MEFPTAPAPHSREGGCREQGCSLPLLSPRATPPPPPLPSPAPLQESQALQGSSRNPARGHPPTSCRDLHQQLDSGSGETSGPRLPAPNCLKHKAISCQRHLTPPHTWVSQVRAPGSGTPHQHLWPLCGLACPPPALPLPPSCPAPTPQSAHWAGPCFAYGHQAVGTTHARDFPRPRPLGTPTAWGAAHLRSQEQGGDDDAIDEQDPIQQVAELGVQQAEALCLCAKRWGWSARPWVTDTTPRVAPRLDKDIMTRGAGPTPHPPSVPNLPPTP